MDTGDREHEQDEHLLRPRDLPWDVLQLLQYAHVLALLVGLKDEVGEVSLVAAQVAQRPAARTVHVRRR